MSEWIAKPIKDGKKHLGDEYMGDLIRCRDCRYKNEYNQCTYYINFHHWTSDMDYCSGAERRDKRNG